jgi:hypothetical protein
MSADIATANAPRWAPERRLEFIDFRLQWDRTLNRTQLMGVFGISAQQSSADLARYMESAPGNLTYDKSAKTYRAAPEFVPLFTDADSHTYLDRLADVASDRATIGAAFIGWRPPCDVLQLPVRIVEPDTLATIVEAMRGRHDIHVRYQSMRRSATSMRWIAPHALASDGLRWHVRAWCYESAEYKDFVLSRIRSISRWRARTDESFEPPPDISWNKFIDIVIRPRKGLSPDQRKAIEMEYGMVRGRHVMRCRQAMASYLLRLMHLDELESSLSLIQQPLEVELTSEVAEVIAATRKSPEESKAMTHNNEGD